MLRKLLLLTAIFLAPLCGQSYAQGTLGTVSTTLVSGTGTCAPVAGSAIAGGTCYAVTVSCPAVASQTNIIAKVLPPTSGNNSTTVAMISGLGGGGLYEANWGSTGQGILTSLQADGFTLVELDWPLSVFSNGGWLLGPGGTKELACRPASILKYIQTTLATNTHQCATGTSGGAAALAYALDYYKLNWDYALLTSGPPLSRYDWGCDNSKPTGNFNPITGTTTSQQFSITAFSVTGGQATFTYSSSYSLSSNITGVLSGFGTTDGLILDGQTVIVSGSGLTGSTFKASVTGLTNSGGTITDSGTLTLNSSLSFLNIDAQSVVDIGYSYSTTPSPNYCEYELANNATQFDSVLLYDSVMGPTATYNFSTPVYFEFGGQDISNAPVQAYLFSSAVGSNNYHITADAPHEIGEVADGATNIVNDIANSCP